MSSLRSEMINTEMLKATVDRYEKEIREIVNPYNESLVYIGMVVQTFVDNDKAEIEGLKKDVISDDFLEIVCNVGSKNHWLYLHPYETVKKHIASLGLLAKSESNPLCDDGRDQKTRSSLINLSLLTSEMVDERIAELLKEEIVSENDVDTMVTPSADLYDVDDEIQRILPCGEYFRNFIVLLSEINKRSGCGIALPNVSDFVSLGHRFITLVKENAALEKKRSLTEEEERQRIYLASYDSRIQENLRNLRLVNNCRMNFCQNSEETLKKAAVSELEEIFPHIKSIASLFVDVDYLNLNCTEMSVLTFVKAELKCVSSWKNVSPYVEFCAKRSKDAISDTVLNWLKSARFAAYWAAGTKTDNMEKCKIGGAIDKDNLMLQLLAAAIFGYEVENIKKTF